MKQGHPALLTCSWRQRRSRFWRLDKTVLGAKRRHEGLEAMWAAAGGLRCQPPDLAGVGGEMGLGFVFPKGGALAAETGRDEGQDAGPLGQTRVGLGGPTWTEQRGLYELTM